MCHMPFLMMNYSNFYCSAGERRPCTCKFEDVPSQYTICPNMVRLPGATLGRLNAEAELCSVWKPYKLGNLPEQCTSGRQQPFYCSHPPMHTLNKIIISTQLIFKGVGSVKPHPLQLCGVVANRNLLAQGLSHTYNNLDIIRMNALTA